MASPARWSRIGDAPADRVTEVEVFFDLVFAFTLTQLTRALEHDFTWAGGGRLLLVFGVLWYMYGGYAWLTNHVPPRRASQKLVLFTGMAGFLLAAVAVPRAFGDAGALFGVAYLLVVVVHLVLFSQADVGEGLLRLAPFNLLGALLLLAAGHAGDTARHVLWIAGFGVMTVAPYLLPRWSWVRAARTFHLVAPHFVERHGLLVMIALGESVIAIGMGVDAAHVGAATAAVIVLALALPGALWWTYFTDARGAEHALAHVEAAARTLRAMRAYYFAHIPILIGIVAAAAGLHAAIAHPDRPLEARAAVALTLGVALFLAGVAEFGRALSIGSPARRLVTAGIVLALTPLGTWTGGAAAVAAVLVVLVVMLALDPTARHGRMAA